MASRGAQTPQQIRTEVGRLTEQADAAVARGDDAAADAFIDRANGLIEQHEQLTGVRIDLHGETVGIPFKGNVEPNATELLDAAGIDPSNLTLAQQAERAARLAADAEAAQDAAQEEAVRAWVERVLEVEVDDLTPEELGDLVDANLERFEQDAIGDAALPPPGSVPVGEGEPDPVAEMADFLAKDIPLTIPDHLAGKVTPGSSAPGGTATPGRSPEPGGTGGTGSTAAPPDAAPTQEGIIPVGPGTSTDSAGGDGEAPPAAGDAETPATTPEPGDDGPPPPPDGAPGGAEPAVTPGGGEPPTSSGEDAAPGTPGGGGPGAETQTPDAPTGQAGGPDDVPELGGTPVVHIGSVPQDDGTTVDIWVDANGTLYNSEGEALDEESSAQIAEAFEQQTGQTINDWAAENVPPAEEGSDTGSGGASSAGAAAGGTEGSTTGTPAPGEGEGEAEGEGKAEGEAEGEGEGDGDGDGDGDTGGEEGGDSGTDSEEDSADTGDTSAEGEADGDEPPPDDSAERPGPDAVTPMDAADAAHARFLIGDLASTHHGIRVAAQAGSRIDPAPDTGGGLSGGGRLTYEDSSDIRGFDPIVDPGEDRIAFGEGATPTIEPYDTGDIDPARGPTEPLGGGGPAPSTADEPADTGPQPMTFDDDLAAAPEPLNAPLDDSFADDLRAPDADLSPGREAADLDLD